MKITIAYPYLKEQRGGGSVFLKALRKEWIRQGVYTEHIREADCVLVNSHHGFLKALLIKLFFPRKRIVHRIDGPMASYNPGDKRDRLVARMNKLADATVFQSEWSRRENHRRGLPTKKRETVIHNAADPAFKPVPSKQLGAKVKLLATSWSVHPNKGFTTYEWLDQHLDWNKYEMTFIGTLPNPFKNIKHVPAVRHQELPQYFQQADIFIFASKIEACSNALLEALQSKVPVVAYSGSSNPELVKSGGELFTEPSEIPALLQKIESNYNEYQTSCKTPTISESAHKYYRFIKGNLLV